MRNGLRQWRIRLRSAGVGPLSAHGAQSSVLRNGALILSATVLLYAGLSLARPLLSAFMIRMPENYEFLATRHAREGDYASALRACDREIEQAPYNFHAVRLKADLLGKAGKTEEALRLLWELPDRHRAIRGRSDVPSRGWDPARIHLQTAQTLWAVGRYEEALDELQAARDWADPDITAQCRDFIGARASSPATGSASLDERAWTFVGQAMFDEQIRLDRISEADLFGVAKAPPGVFARLASLASARQQIKIARQLVSREAALHADHLPSVVARQQFLRQFPPERTWSGPVIVKSAYAFIERATVGRVMFGANTPDPTIYQAKGSWINLYRTGAAPGTMRVWDNAKGMCIVAKGTPCLGVWPILVVRRNGQVVGRRYISSSHDQVYALPMAIKPTLETIEVGFENDEYNPVTGQDRNLAISEFRLY